MAALHLRTTNELLRASSQTARERAEIREQRDAELAKSIVRALRSSRNGLPEEAQRQLETLLIQRFDSTESEIARYWEEFPPSPDESLGLLWGASLLPNYEAGELLGLSIRSLVPTAPLGELGLTVGDTIVRVGTISAQTPRSAAGALQALGGRAPIEVEFVRADGSSHVRWFGRLPE